MSLNMTRRRRLPMERAGIIQRFTIGDQFKAYVKVGFFEDGSPGEVFLKVPREDTLTGLLDTIAILTSICLQIGVPLRYLVDKFSHMRFAPAGMTDHPDIKIAKSPVDFVFRWLGSRFPEAMEERPYTDEVVWVAWEDGSRKILGVYTNEEAAQEGDGVQVTRYSLNRRAKDVG